MKYCYLCTDISFLEIMFLFVMILLQIATDPP